MLGGREVGEDVRRLCGLACRICVSGTGTTARSLREGDVLLLVPRFFLSRWSVMEAERSGDGEKSKVASVAHRHGRPRTWPVQHERLQARAQALEPAVGVHFGRCDPRAWDASARGARREHAQQTG